MPEKNSVDRRYDGRDVYCRMLGHVLPFRYCRTMQEGLPCGRILDCWFELMDIRTFVAENYSVQEQERIFSPMRSRLDALFSVVSQVQKEQSKDK